MCGCVCVCRVGGVLEGGREGGREGGIVFVCFRVLLCHTFHFILQMNEDQIEASTTFVSTFVNNVSYRRVLNAC
jgi:hypothetical protein